MNERFEETAAWLEYCDGMTRFEAETEAARRQGKSRWEAIGDAARRVVSETRDRRQAMGKGAGPNDMPGVQPAPEEIER